MRVKNSQGVPGMPEDLIDSAALARLMKTSPSTIEWLLAHDPSQLPQITIHAPFGPLWSHAKVVNWAEATGKSVER